LIAGFDLGMQGNPTTDQTDIWHAAAVMLRYRFTPKATLCARGEYYADPSQVVIQTGAPHGFQTIGYSLNFDYAPAENLLWRIEARGLHSQDEVLRLHDAPSRQNFVIATSMAVSF
jgi:hypothetical protein